MFGDITDGVMELNEFGSVIREELLKSTEIREELAIDYYTIMPNHLHCIVIIDNLVDSSVNVGANVVHVGANGRSPLHLQEKRLLPGMKPKSLSSFIAGFKSICTKRINKIRKTPGRTLWQRNYFDRVIRKELFEIRKYIEYNPFNWETDSENIKFSNK